MQAQKLQAFLKRRPVKIVSIILLSLLLLFIIALTAISLYVHNNKGKIIARVKTEFARRINGELTIGDIDLSVWKNFPNIAIELKNVIVADSLYHSPLLKANQISCAVNIFQLTSSKPDIARIKVSGALFHLFVDSSGFNNDYLLSPKKQDTSAVSKTESEAAPQPIVIRHIELENFTFISEDKIKDKKYGVEVSTATADIKRRDSVLIISFKEDCMLDGLGFNLAKGVYLGHSAIKGKWQMEFDKSAKVLTVEQSPVEINGNDFKIAASFHFNKDSSYFTLHAITDKILYKDARALLTEKIQNKLKFIDVTSPMQIDAKLTGPLTHGGDPFVYVVCKTEKNILITPAANFADCNFTGIYDNMVDTTLPPSDPNSVVYFPQFTGKWFSVPLQGDSIRIDNLSDPTMVFKFGAQCSFSQLDDALNLQNISFDDGSAKLNLQYRGPLTTDATILANLTGSLHVENGKLTYVPHNLQFINCSGDLAFGKNSINIKSITCDYKKNHFQVTGSGSLNRISGVDSSNSGIFCNIFCPSFNVSDFQQVFAKPVNRQASSVKKKNNGNTIAGLDNLLEKGDIQLNINAKELSLQKFNAQNAKVYLLLQQNDWKVQRASLDFDGGSFMVDANMHRNSNNFTATAHVNIKDADVRKVFYAFNNFGQDGILYSNLKGILNTDASLNMLLDDKGSITPGSLQGVVNFSITNGALINYTPVIAIQDYALKNRDLNNIEFAEIKNTLTIKQNQVIIPRMEIASTAMRLFVEGVYGVAQTPTDISIQVPLSNLSKPDTDKKVRNKGVDAKVGPSVYLRAKSKADGKVKVGLDLFRKFRKGNVDTTAGGG